MENEDKTDKDLSLKDLNYYTGTTKYIKGLFGVNLTEGVEYISKSGYWWFVSDAMVNTRLTDLKEQEFVVIELKLLEGNKAEVLYSDGNGNELYKQKYNYTDAKREVKLFLTDDVLMLAGEY